MACCLDSREMNEWIFVDYWRAATSVMVQPMVRSTRAYVCRAMRVSDTVKRLGSGSRARYLTM